MHKRCLRGSSLLVYLSFFLTAVANGQPAIATGGVVNAASYGHAGLPNAGIAQGSIFTVFGTGLGPASSPSLTLPLATTLGGVSIAVTQGTTSVAAIPVYVSANQVSAIMPSNAPLGTDAVTVNYQGQTSAAATAQVVASSFGIFTINSSGGGQGIFTSATNQIITYTSAAHTGDTVVMWGTGLGAIVGGDANLPPVGNIAANNPVLYVGGVSVTPLYHGRSGCCSGTDQISFQIPANVSGCSVPVAVQIGNVVSNFTTIAVAASGNTCTGPSGFPASELTQLASNGSASVGTVIYQKFTTTSPGFSLLGGGSSTVSGTQEIANFTKEQFTDVTAFAPVVSAGSCSVFTFNGTAGSIAGLISSTGLDAGPSITVAGGGAQGQLMTSSSAKGLYSARFNLPDASYTFTGPGGADVGAFSVIVPVTQPTLAWTNQSSAATIQRANGVSVTWTGADPNGTVQITGSSATGTSASNAAGAGFTCTAPGTAGQFTVPAAVLLALPASANLNSSLLNVSTGSLGVSSSSVPLPFGASGLDIGLAFVQAAITNSTVIYQ